jgi:hypothetical protein
MPNHHDLAPEVLSMPNENVYYSYYPYLIDYGR